MSFVEGERPGWGKLNCEWHKLFLCIERGKFWIFRILVVVLLLEIGHLSVYYAAPYIRPVLHWA